MFSIDGQEWNISCKIKRKAEMTASEISGLLLNKTYFNDIIGTFMTYDVTLEVPVWAQSRYATLYELLTAPVGYHTLIMPYNDGDITILGRIQVVSDIYIGKRNGRRRWRETTFTVIANSPNKTTSLSEIITAGLSPYPEVPEANVGDLYEYTSGGWVERDYSDGDVRSY